MACMILLYDSEKSCSMTKTLTTDWLTHTKYIIKVDDIFYATLLRTWFHHISTLKYPQKVQNLSGARTNRHKS